MSAFDVSVVIPLYNKEAFVRDMLASVLAQSLPAAEIIIVDDSSTDGSVAKIADLIGGQVRLLSQPNAGPGPARNRGIAEASSEWIAFIDADDQWQPNHLATLAEVAAQCPDSAVVAARHQRMTATDPVPAPDNSPVAARRIDFFRDAQRGEILSSTSVAVRRAALTEAGGFGAFYPGEDFELWTRLALDHVIAVSERFTALYLQQTGGLMERHEARTTASDDRQPVFATLARAIADPRHAAKRPALKQYRAYLLRQNIRQAIYRAAPRDARRFAAELRAHGGDGIGWLALLMWLPAPLLRLGRVARNAFRRRLRGKPGGWKGRCMALTPAGVNRMLTSVRLHAARNRPTVTIP